MTERPTILVNHLLEPPNRISGISRYLFALLTRLVALPQYRFVLATTWSADQIPDSVRATGIEIITQPFYEKTPRNILQQMVVLPRLMRKTGAVLEFNCNPIGCFRRSWPRVITVHDLYFDVLPQSYNWRHRLWWRLFFPRSLNAASAVICVSDNTRKDVERFHPGFERKLTVVHEADILDAGLGETECPEDLARSPYAIYVGNVSPNKNAQTLVRALALLEAGSDAPLVRHVGGDGQGLLAQALAETPLKRPPMAAGVVDDHRLATLYRHATCLVNTSTYEGFCLPILEAQAFGLPVICADIGVLREVAGDSALFFDPEDPQALATHIHNVFGDADLRKRLHETSLRNVQRFSWQRAAEETQAVFDRVLRHA